MSKILKYAILIMGLGFIVAIFFMVLKGIQPPKLFILNLTFFVFNAAFIYLRIIRRKIHTAENDKLDEATVTGRRIMWVSSLLYSGASLLTIIMSMLHRWEFRGALKVQIILLLALLFLYIHSRIAMRDVMKKMERRKEAQIVIAAMAEKAKYISRIIRARDYNSTYISVFEQMSEYIAGLSTPRNKRSKQLEVQLGDKLEKMSTIVEADSLDTMILDREIEATRNLISLRRDA